LEIIYKFHHPQPGSEYQMSLLRRPETSSEW
jgi:hypothetical protein